mmetsp:Transcript_7735/g.11747  ORF Transcript_7735/g.11747 Transcript_7735/m.11747 type:complete len:312 (+) Transcript_7735:1-936(+)
MKLLVDKGANVNALDRHGNTPLHDAFRQGQRAAAQLLTSLGGRLAYSRKRMATELCTAVRESDINTVRQLLDFKCDAEAPNDDGRTCLHVAAAVGNLAIIELLLERGANPDAKDNSGFTPKFMAVRNGHSSCAASLHKHRGSLGLSVEDAAAQLNNAVRHSKMEMLERLIEAGADPGAPDYDGRTCMHVAASMGNVSMVEFLLRKGVDPNHRDRWGGTPLSDAAREGHENVAEVLLCSRWDTFTLQGSADPNLADTDGRTVLHLAACNGNYELAEMLLKAGATKFAKDNWGYTPKGWAERLNYPPLVKLLS